jgi:hypothetical protein
MVKAPRKTLPAGQKRQPWSLWLCAGHKDILEEVAKAQSLRGKGAALRKAVVLALSPKVSSKTPAKRLDMGEYESRWQVMLNPIERADIAKLAKKFKTSESDAVRLAIEFFDVKPKPKPAKRKAAKR